MAEAAGAVRLIQTEKGLSITDGDRIYTGDFSRLLPRLAENRLNGELVVRACRPKKQKEGLTLLDATAGMGEDSFLLAAAGFDVTLCEQDEIIFDLLSDAIGRAKLDPVLSEPAGRMHALRVDSISYMGKLKEAPDVVLLDPMFPERTKSALVKKKFQLIHGLEKPCENESDLLEAALHLNPGRKPSFSISGKTIRYDIIVTVHA